MCVEILGHMTLMNCNDVLSLRCWVPDTSGIRCGHTTTDDLEV